MEKDFQILKHLRKNNRGTLTGISKSTGIPVTTVYDRIKMLDQNQIIKKSVCLLDFSKLGFHIKAHFALKVKEREQFLEFISKQECLNSLYRINHGFDFLFEAIFKDMNETRAFSEFIEKNFTVLNRQFYYILEDLKQEEFLGK